jgi:hypothetical protein
MKRIAGKSLLMATGMLLAATPGVASAQIPVLTAPDVIVGSASGTAPELEYTAVLTNCPGGPCAGIFISIDFNTGPGASGIAAPVHPHAIQKSPTVVDCATRTLTQITNDQGEVAFKALFGGAENLARVQISANGVPMKLITARSTDVDDSGETDLNDLNRFRINFFTPGPGPDETDFNDDLDTELGDLDIFRKEYFSGAVVPRC